MVAVGFEYRKLIMAFDYSLDYQNINFRQHPELYRVGKGEQGVLLVEPYKSEILPYWRFKTPEIARESSEKIYQLFLEYLKKDDFIGADMARKFLQMGYTRSRRYANHKSGRKYQRSQSSSAQKEILPYVEILLCPDLGSGYIKYQQDKPQNG
jgi:hypothetical protein